MRHSIAEQLIERGWVQQKGWDVATGHVCLGSAAQLAANVELAEVGVVLNISTSLSLYSDTERALIERTINAYFAALGRVISLDYGPETIVGFNDSPSTTYDDVLRVAKEADEILAADDPDSHGIL